MRLVRYDGGRTGVLHGETVRDADAVVRPAGSWAPLIGDWPGARAELEALTNGTPLAGVALEAPLPEPAARVFAMGGNFPMHVSGATDKLDLPASLTDPDAPPWGFFVIPGTTVGPEATVTPPPTTRHLDYEAEVGAVLTGGDEPLLWGYTAWNDFSIRDPAFKLSLVDHGPLTWSLQKNFASANACGPCLVVDEGVTVGDLRIVCRVNGETRQDGTTADMNFDFAAIAAHIGEYLPLRAGDMILSGTPAGTAMEGGPDGRFLQDGDVTEVEVGETGVLRNTIALTGR